MKPAHSAPWGPIRVLLPLLITGAGYAAWIALLDPDPWHIGLGHPEQFASPRGVIALVALLVQSIALILLRGRYRHAWQAAAALAGGPRQALLLLLVNALLATAAINPPILFPFYLLLTFIAMTSGTLSLIAAVSVRDGGHLERFFSSRRLPEAVAALAGVLSLLISTNIFHRIPHIPDEVIYLFQAKYFAAGRLYLPVGSVPQAFDIIHTTTAQGHWFGIFPPGWPLLMSLGVLVGAPWLINPILTVVVILVVHRMVTETHDRATAGLAIVLLLLSPWFLYMGGSMMSHMASMLAAITVLRAAIRLTQTARFGDGIAAGIGLGALVLIRPFEGVLVGLATASWLLIELRLKAVNLATLVFGVLALAIGGLTLPYNRALTGDPFRTPIGLYFDTRYAPGSNRLGFGADIGNIGWGNDVLPGHSPLEAAINATFNSHLVQVELFASPAGSLLLALVFLASARRWIGSPADRLMVAVVGVTISGYSLYWYHGADLGPRYWSQIMIPLAALTATAAFRFDQEQECHRWTRFALFGSLIGLPLVGGWRGQVRFHDYRHMTTAMRDLARATPFGHDLVLITGDRFSDYAMGFMYNAPTLDGPGPLYLRAVGGDTLLALRRAYPDRRTWLVSGASLSGDRPRILAGPLPAAGDSR